MKNTRFSQISSEQKKILLSESEPHIAPGLLSYVGRYPEHYEKSRKVIEGAVKNFATADYWLYAFAKYCSSSEVAEPSNYLKIAYNFSNGFCRWINSSGRGKDEISTMDTKAVREFYDFLCGLRHRRGEKKGELLNPNTLRKYYGAFKKFIEILLENEKYANNMKQRIGFISNPFPEAQQSTESTELLDDNTFIRLYATVRELCEETMKKVDYANSILNGQRIPPNFHARGRGKYNNLGALLWALKDLERIPFPSCSGELKITHPDIFNSIAYVHGGTGKVYSMFYPSAENIFPFIVLLAIYSAANTNPLRTLKISEINDVEVMGVMRVKLSFVKNRGKNYSRSFAHDDDDPLSPNKVVDFLKRWGAPLRKVDFSDYLFLFSHREGGGVDVFKTFVESGTDVCGHWTTGMKRLTKLLGLKSRLTTQKIRATALDIVRDISDDDIRAHSAAGGNTEAVLQTYYDSSGAKAKRIEQLAGVMAGQERHVRTYGRIDHRGSADSSDLGAATPGWNCVNPYDSPIDGEVKGRACHAKGMCPACALGFLDINSPYAFARSVQLIDEIWEAQNYVDPRRWGERYKPVRAILMRKWISAFSKFVAEEAKKLSLGPIGRLE